MRWNARLSCRENWILALYLFNLSNKCRQANGDLHSNWLLRFRVTVLYSLYWLIDHVNGTTQTYLHNSDKPNLILLRLSASQPCIQFLMRLDLFQSLFDTKLCTWHLNRTKNCAACTFVRPEDRIQGTGLRAAVWLIVKVPSLYKIHR